MLTSACAVAAVAKARAPRVSAEMVLVILFMTFSDRGCGQLVLLRTPHAEVARQERRRCRHDRYHAARPGLGGDDTCAGESGDDDVFFFKGLAFYLSGNGAGCGPLPGNCGQIVATGRYRPPVAGSGYGADLQQHWWARTVSNRRPLVCKTRALPLSYAPHARRRLHAARPSTQNVRPVKPSAHRSTAVGRGLRRAVSFRRTELSPTGRRRRYPGWSSRPRR